MADKTKCPVADRIAADAERLRDFGAHHGWRLLGEALTELREAHRGWKHAADSYTIRTRLEDEKIQEVERLREALRKLEDYDDGPVSEIARRALSAAPAEPTGTAQGEEREAERLRDLLWSNGLCLQCAKPIGQHDEDALWACGGYAK